MANGAKIYRGPSMLNGEPVKAILTGTASPSTNVKTGDMLQLWIMPVSSKPSEAVKNGDDASVCGSCIHRPSLAKANDAAPCYVEVGKAPNGIWKASYPDTATNKRNAPVRFGAWGEPTAIPFAVLEPLTANGHTGYTHQWRTCDPQFKSILMASVDTPEEQSEAVRQGWRTFRVRKADAPLLDGEIACPASKEAGNKTQCAKCGLCAGNSRQAKNIAIIAH